MNVPCAVIEDLLPLYHDGVCSEESRQLVDGHLEGCRTCRGKLAAMDEEIEVALPDGMAADEAEPLRRVAASWKRSRIRALLLGMLAVAVAGVLGCGIAYNVIGAYVAPDGTLVEPFYLIPIAWLFGLLALVTGLCLLIGETVDHRRR